MKFFAPSGTYSAAGVFTAAHYIFAFVTLSAVIISVYCSLRFGTKNDTAVIRAIALTLVFIETLKIIFILLTEPESDPNSYLPFYFCSIEIYASLLAAFASGKAKKAGEIFMMTGGMVGGIFFIVYPLTSLSFYPALHFISVQSFIYHGIMIFGSIFLLTRLEDRLRLSDIFYYMALVLAVSAVALCINLALGSNLMFLSQNYPGTFIEPIYNALPTPIFTLLAAAVQATLPFLLIFAIYKAVTALSHRK